MVDGKGEVMCKYCNFEPNGDVPANRKDIIHTSLNPKMGVTLEAGIYNNNHLITAIYAKSVDLFEHDLKIRYCPMCGRELNEKK